MLTERSSSSSVLGWNVPVTTTVCGGGCGSAGDPAGGCGGCGAAEVQGCGGTSEPQNRAIEGGRDVVRLAGHLPNVRFEFSPEVFNLTEPDYVLDVCDAVTELWDATPERPVILDIDPERALLIGECVGNAVHQ